MANGNDIMAGRAGKLLRALVGIYIESGDPVSSAALSHELEHTGEHVPPSTIRLDLSQLEREGYLTKPHASGGRIPTSRAYSEYVNSLDKEKEIAIETGLSEKIVIAARALSGELRRLLEYAGEVLAEESGCMGFVTSPSLADGRIQRFKLDAIESNVILIRLELTSGLSYHHLVKLSVPVGNFKLAALAELLTERLSGRKLNEISEAELAALVNHAAQWGRGYDLFIHPLHDLITDARLGEGPITVLHGAAGLLRASGENPETLARAVAFLDDREMIEVAIRSVDKPEDVQIVIGGEGSVDSILDGLALIVASYHIHARARGRLGILGPLRMPYSRHLKLVKSVSDLVSRVLISRELTPRFG
jgi:heat-inducible transcriptional repressor